MSQITCKSTTNVVIRFILSAYPCVDKLKESREDNNFALAAKKTQFVNVELSRGFTYSLRRGLYKQLTLLMLYPTALPFIHSYRTYRIQCV